MRAIIYLTTTSIVYLIATFTVPAAWVNTVQITWLFVTALALWFPPVERFVFPRKEPVEYTLTTDTVPTTTWVLEAKFRELSDAEIKQVFTETTGFDFDDNPGDGMALMDFAHAVVRRAQER